MKRFAILIIIVFTFGTISVLQAQEVKDVVLKDLEPTLFGHQNKAYVEMKMVGSDEEKKEMTVFWIKEGPEQTLTAALGGLIGGGGIMIGMQGEKICMPGTHIAVDSASEYVGNLDYDGSIYTFLGTVRLVQYQFQSDNDSPLTFKLEKGKGAVYVSGKGSVKTKDGKEIKIGE